LHWGKWHDLEADDSRLSAPDEVGLDERRNEGLPLWGSRLVVESPNVFVLPQWPDEVQNDPPIGAGLARVHEWQGAGQREVGRDQEGL
jgi:hypothetical protein